MAAAVMALGMSVVVVVVVVAVVTLVVGSGGGQRRGKAVLKSPKLLWLFPPMQ